MEVKVEKMSENNMYRFIIEATAEEFEKGVEKAYQKNKGQIVVPGFRKGKATRQIIEKMYGKNFFHQSAIEEIVPELYEQAKSESDLLIVSRPRLKVVEMNEEKPLVFTAEVAVKPEIKLGKYKGVEIGKHDVAVSDEEIESELKKVQNSNARVVEVTDRGVQDKDITTIDFEGSIDGTPFEGGKGTDYPLTIGSHTFIDTFEDQMIGMNLNEEREVKVTFPEDYHASGLKGKDAVFKVTVKEIKERQLPELDDEFAQDVSEFDTIKEYKDSIKEKLEDQKKAHVKDLKEREALDEVIAAAEMDVPEAMIDNQVNRMSDDFEMNLSRQGMKVENYLKYVGLTPEKFIADLKPEAEKRVKQRLVLEQIVVDEKLDATDDELKEEIETVAKQYQVEPEEFEKTLSPEAKRQIVDDIKIRKALKLIVEEAKEVEKKEEKAEKKEEKAEKKETAKKPAAKKTTAKKTTAKKETSKKEEE